MMVTTNKWTVSLVDKFYTLYNMQKGEMKRKNYIRNLIRFYVWAEWIEKKIRNKHWKAPVIERIAYKSYCPQIHLCDFISILFSLGFPKSSKPFVWKTKTNTSHTPTNHLWTVNEIPLQTHSICNFSHFTNDEIFELNRTIQYSIHFVVFARYCALCTVACQRNFHSNNIIIPW